jgi:hypothetical protein
MTNQVPPPVRQSCVLLADLPLPLRNQIHPPGSPAKPPDARQRESSNDRAPSVPDCTWGSNRTALEGSYFHALQTDTLFAVVLSQD